jgi:hypothetical protein
MADGLSAAVANAAATNIVGTDAAYVQLHTGAPGANGTANVSSVTTREAQTWGSASAGAVAATGTPTWASWGGVNGEVVTDISHWSASTSGTFGHSVQLTAPVTVHTGDTIELTSDTVTLPVAS